MTRIAKGECKMTDKDKLLRMYKELHGEVTGSCYLEMMIDPDDEYTPIGVQVMKDGNLCSTYTKTDLLFDYITKNWSE